MLPNLAGSWDVERRRAGASPSTCAPARDGRTATPFTADDVLFNMNDVVLNRRFAPIPPRYMVGGKPVKVEKVDDATVRFTFAEPYGDFLAELASPLGQHPVLYPEALLPAVPCRLQSGSAEAVAERPASDWQTYSPPNAATSRSRRAGAIPTSRRSIPGSSTSPMSAVRSVSCWSATPISGRSTPRAISCPTSTALLPIAQDVESLILDAIGGKIDLQVRHLDNAANRPVLAENREKGGYEFFEAKPPGGTNMASTST